MEAAPRLSGPALFPTGWAAAEGGSGGQRRAWGETGKAGQGGESSPFREKEELPWTAGPSSELWMVEEYSQTLEV